MAIINHINNYYEQLVSDEIRRQVETWSQAPEMDFMVDVGRVALNRLPPKYYRYEVDMAFYMSPNELHEVKEKVSTVVSEAITFVQAHNRKD